MSLSAWLPMGVSVSPVCTVGQSSTWFLTAPFSFSPCVQLAHSPVTMGTGRMTTQPLTKKALVSHVTLLYLHDKGQASQKG